MLSYLDSNILIMGATGKDRRSALALEIINDPLRQFASSIYVQLEVMPRAIFFEIEEELAFYTGFNSTVAAWAVADQALTALAFEIARAENIRAMDALHIACALQLGADEFVTAESPRERLTRTTRIKVITI